MTFLSGFLPIAGEPSVIVSIDGVGCEEESFMGWWGLLIWIPFVIYLMVGQFVICEEYFVPVLAQLGDRWAMAEDVQGATLLAVGSSSPELFTALLGVILYPDDNPGPGTNVGSAVFNMCIIIGLSAIFAPRTAKLAIVPFLRDSIAYMIGLIELYLFYAVISPQYMEIWESILLCAWWAAYVFMVYRTDLLAVRCCCCVPEKEVNKVLPKEQAVELESIADAKGNGGTDYVALGGAEEDNDNFHKPSYTRSKSVVQRGDSGKMGVLYDEKGHPVADMEQNPDNIRIGGGGLGGDNADEELQKLLDELNRRQRQNVNKGWVVVVMPTDQAKRQGFMSSGNDGVERGGDVVGVNSSGRHNATSHAYVRRRTLLETLAHDKEVAEQEAKAHEYHGVGDDESELHHHGKGSEILHKVLAPWTWLFGKTLPAPEGAFAANHIYLTILGIVCWLGILTFFVVDGSIKLGQCFRIPGDLLGITLLAVGSSLPDCISSVIVARQMKIDMAVANAFGSNIFDVNLCVGFGFLLGSIAAAIQGESTKICLGDEKATLTFSELIAAAAAFLVLLWIMMWCTIFRLERWIGYLLCMIYVGYICVFTTLLVHDEDSGDEGEATDACASSAISETVANTTAPTLFPSLFPTMTPSSPPTLEPISN